MTTYNTMNPVPSVDARDRYDNSQVFDELMNGPAPNTPDRLGVLRQSWAGIEQDFSRMMAGFGFSNAGPYAGGLVLVSHQQYVEVGGQPYVLKATTPVPYEVTGDWATESVNFKLAGDETLRQELAGPYGFSFVGRSVAYVSTYAEARALEKDRVDLVLTLGALAAGDGGFGAFRMDAADVTSTDNGGSVLVTADGGRLKLVQSTPQRLSQFSAVCDGVADDSAQLQALIDANKGKKIVIDKGTPMIGAVTLIGSTYDRTEIHCEGGTLKLAPDGGVASFGGAWVGLLFKDCSDNKANLKFDGNADAMTQTREQIFCVGSAGTSDFDSDFLTFNNIAGDGIYVSQSDWQAESATTKRMSITKITGENTTDRGRNTISIIAVSGLTIGMVESTRVGGLIGAVWQPGGIDIEPNVGYQKCEDISIAEARVISAGSSGIAVMGKALTNDAAGDWNTQRISIGSFTLTLTRAGGGGFAVTRCFDLKLNGQVIKPTASFGSCATISYVSRIQGHIKTQGGTNGILAGVLGQAVTDFELDVLCTGFSGAGLRNGELRRGKFTGRLGLSSAAGSFGIQCHAGSALPATQQNMVYEVDIPYDGNMVRAFRNEPSNPIAFVNSYVRNCDWTGYSSPSVTNDTLIFCENVKGHTDQLVMPASGAWVAGMTVKPRTFTVNAGKVLREWVRLTTGATNTGGTDWSPVYGTTS